MNNYLKNNLNQKKINIYLFISLIPLLITGFYKNGIKLYINDLVGIPGLLKPLILDILGFTIGILVNIIYEKIIKKKPGKLKHIIFDSYHPLYGLLIASVISINTNIILFILVTFIMLLLSKFIKQDKINIVALTALIIIFIINITETFTFNNAYEKVNNLNLDALDYLIGRGSGGVNTTHVILLIISLVILCNQKFYKKEIPFYSSIFFSLGIIIYSVITNDIGKSIDHIFSNGILFTYVFIATDSLTSPRTYKGKIIYSIIIGLVTVGLYIIYPPLSALGTVVIGSMCHDTIDKLCEK